MKKTAVFMGFLSLSKAKTKLAHNPSSAVSQAFLLGQVSFLNELASPRKNSSSKEQKKAIFIGFLSLYGFLFASHIGHMLELHIICAFPVYKFTLKPTFV